MEANNNSLFIVTIGASAGGLDAVSELVSQLPRNLNAAVFIVLHLSKVGVGDLLVNRIKKHTAWICSIPQNNETIEPGHIYIAPPDRHLLIKNNHIIIGNGPAENRWRPSVDVLFRSAAASHGEKVIGIVLTGFLNDGTSGMWAIKRSGGHCVVQDPNEAEYPDMPLSVLNNMEVDYCISLKDTGKTIQDILKTSKIKGIRPPEEVMAESALSERMATDIAHVQELGEKTLYTCPDCGGGLWSIDTDNIKRYRCHIGHSFSEKDLLIKQSESLEATLWIAVRMMEERKNLLTKLGKNAGTKGFETISLHNLKQADELDAHINKLKELLFGVMTNSGNSPQ
jgi:two-component system chemotaxis response regulator CheB